MCVSVVTIRQCAESFSIRVGADHFLVRHHPGGGVIHLEAEEQTVKDTDRATLNRKLKESTDSNTRPWLVFSILIYALYSTITVNMSAVVCWFSLAFYPTGSSL